MFRRILVGLIVVTLATGFASTASAEDGASPAGCAGLRDAVAYGEGAAIRWPDAGRGQAVGLDPGTKDQRLVVRGT
ncbi:hypothetical protein [Kibdelosporangium phytohabitans]|uniref:Uncharacterized protein n=1 Tax=Kibdelosporangium phytohabitans TaxID=860235 RepID=A0A0N9HYP8_9PSEU|nr:hypothetical protein [Kibdelosporangium phytohabitans]ALG10547.1 hypothetical protein AOZ06_29895 [Kibdelosporangium phytohabitans]MBE1461646.1 hypothetical protein [Kibdelosporangium phytohabitans]